jgi:amidophosphoribosyltransferase
MKRVVAALQPRLQGFEASCFDGRYITGDIGDAQIAALQAQRPKSQDEDAVAVGRLALQSNTDS